MLNLAPGWRFLLRRVRPAPLPTSEAMSPRLDRLGSQRRPLRSFTRRRLGAEPKNVRHRNDAIARIDLLQLSQTGKG